MLPQKEWVPVFFDGKECPDYESQGSLQDCQAMSIVLSSLKFPLNFQDT